MLTKLIASAKSIRELAHDRRLAEKDAQIVLLRKDRYQHLGIFGGPIYMQRSTMELWKTRAQEGLAPNAFFGKDVTITGNTFFPPKHTGRVLICSGCTLQDVPTLSSISEGPEDMIALLIYPKATLINTVFRWDSHITKKILIGESTRITSGCIHEGVSIGERVLLSGISDIKPKVEIEDDVIFDFNLVTPAYWDRPRLTLASGIKITSGTCIRTWHDKVEHIEEDIDNVTIPANLMLHKIDAERFIRLLLLPNSKLINNSQQQVEAIKKF